jgi:hypothetical protein
MALPLKERVSRAIERGKEIGADSATFDFAWYRFFGFEKDPFYQRPATLDDVSAGLFVNRSDELESIGEMIGVASSSQSGLYNLAVIGANKTGKSSVAGVIHDISQEKGIPGIIYNVKTDPDLRGPSPEGLSYIILDQCKDPERTRVVAEKIRMTSDDALLVVFLLEPEEYEAVLDLEPDIFDREIFLSPMSESDCRSIVNSRLGMQEESVSALIEEKAIDEIIVYSQGLCGFMIEFLGDSFRIAFKKHKERVELSDVTEALRRYKRLDLSDIELTTRERDTLGVMLRLRTAHATTVGGELGVKHNVSWKYLDRLRKKGLLSKSYEGKRTYYSINPFVAAQLQLHLYAGESYGN